MPWYCKTWSSFVGLTTSSMNTIELCAITALFVILVDTNEHHNRARLRLPQYRSRPFSLTQIVAVTDIFCSWRTSFVSCESVCVCPVVATLDNWNDSVMTNGRKHPQNSDVTFLSTTSNQKGKIYLKYETLPRGLQWSSNELQQQTQLADNKAHKNLSASMPRSLVAMATLTPCHVTPTPWRWPVELLATGHQG